MDARGLAKEAVAQHEVFWPPGRARFRVAEGETLLRAAERAGLGWPSSCRNGTCRTCLQPLAAGEVRYLVEWPGLLPEERTGGWVLPCVALPCSDLVVGALPTAQ